MEGLLELLLRALHYALLLGLFGATAFPPIGLRNIKLPDAVCLMTGAAVLAPLVSLALMLVGVAAMMGQPLASLTWSTVESIVGATSIGWAFLVRLALLVAAVPLTRSHPRVAALLYAATLATLPWNGHAAVSEGAPGLAHRLNDVVHLLAAGLWLGAIGWFTALSWRLRQNPETARWLLVAMHRFALLGIGLVATVAVTGLANSLFIIDPWPAYSLLMSTYGQALALKLALVALMLICAVRHSRISRQEVSLPEAESGGHARSLVAVRRSLASELAFGLGVIGVVAVLGTLSPAGT